MSEVLRNVLRRLAKEDVILLLEKGKTYGDSWKKRGGVGAYMMLARKWDRIEKAAESNGWDIFKAIEEVDHLLDDIIDLRCYLFLVQSEGYIYEEAGAEPEPHGYVNQDEPAPEKEDPWNGMATDHAKKQLTRMGDSELLEYCEVTFDPSLTADQRRILILNLRMFHDAVLTGQKPHRDLEDIMDACHAVLSYTNPYRRVPGLCATC